MIRIAPSILGSDDKVKLVNELIGLGIDWIHYDIMDGKFVDNNSLPNKELYEVISNTNDHITDFHLMVERPLEYFKKLEVKPKYCSMHFEEIKKNESEIINFIKDSEVKFGIAINPKYELKDIRHIIHNFDYVLIMSVEAGYGGQSFIETTIDKIHEIADYIFEKNLDMIIQVDGGINNNTIGDVVDAGANNAVVGSYLQKNLSQATVDNLKK